MCIETAQDIGQKRPALGEVTYTTLSVGLVTLSKKGVHPAHLACWVLADDLATSYSSDADGLAGEDGDDHLYADSTISSDDTLFLVIIYSPMPHPTIQGLSPRRWREGIVIASSCAVTSAGLCGELADPPAPTPQRCNGVELQVSSLTLRNRRWPESRYLRSKGVIDCAGAYGWQSAARPVSCCTARQCSAM